MTICTYTHILASEAAIEDLIMQAKMIKCAVIGLTETKRRHPLNALYETGEELFLGTCDSRGVGGVGAELPTPEASASDAAGLIRAHVWNTRGGPHPSENIRAKTHGTTSPVPRTATRNPGHARGATTSPEPTQILKFSQHCWKRWRVCVVFHVFPKKESQTVRGRLFP
ncbi:hypothetical protein RB195_024817 [Necator americanus]|uniref:Uncharacterized protein n=1 Tax=Necator americanus TaxID=51031 RepID=A0ABR1EPQ6_NECAM